MKTKTNIMTSPKISLVASAILTSCLLAIAVHAAPTAKTDAPATSQPTQKEFDTPKQAADSLLQAAETFDVAALKEILGPDSEDLVASEDPVMDTKTTRSRSQPRRRKRTRLRSIRKIWTTPFYG